MTDRVFDYLAREHKGLDYYIIGMWIAAMLILAALLAIMAH